MKCSNNSVSGLSRRFNQNECLGIEHTLFAGGLCDMCSQRTYVPNVVIYDANWSVYQLRAFWWPCKKYKVFGETKNWICLEWACRELFGNRHTWDHHYLINTWKSSFPLTSLNGREEVKPIKWSVFLRNWIRKGR